MKNNIQLAEMQEAALRYHADRKAAAIAAVLAYMSAKGISFSDFE